ncbi:MAG: Rab family GTPase [Candidatus Hodarchaeales archaeon]|jgi:small GTP-binding protein
MALLAKICILGDGMVGKTSLVNRYLGKGFTSEYLPTLGSDFASKEIYVQTKKGTRLLRLQIWDLAGQPSFQQIRTRYYKRAAGALLVFDVTRPESFENLKLWINEFYKYVESPQASIILLGNKIDLQGKNIVSSDTVRRFIDLGLTESKIYLEDDQFDYLETSAKTGENVEKAFQIIGKQIIKRIGQGI